MKCFRYSLNQNNQGPAVVLPLYSITGLYINGHYYGAALIDDLSVLIDWNAEEITPLEFNTITSMLISEDNPEQIPMLVKLEPSIRKKYSELMENVVKPYTIQERETWFIQVEEALKWSENNNIDSSEIPLISAIGTERNEPLENIVNNILQKNNEYKIAIGTILGQQQALIKSIWSMPA